MPMHCQNYHCRLNTQFDEPEEVHTVNMINEWPAVTAKQVAKETATDATLRAVSAYVQKG